MHCAPAGDNLRNRAHYAYAVRLCTVADAAKTIFTDCLFERLDCTTQIGKWYYIGSQFIQLRSDQWICIVRRCNINAPEIVRGPDRFLIKLPSRYLKAPAPSFSPSWNICNRNKPFQLYNSCSDHRVHACVASGGIPKATLFVSMFRLSACSPRQWTHVVHCLS